MFAVGPPRSWITPAKPSIFTSRSVSRTSDPADLLWIILPWWCPMAQKEQPPKQPRWLTRENLTGSRAGISSRYEGWARRVYGELVDPVQLTGREREGRGVLDDHGLPMVLGNPLSPDRILFPGMECKRPCVRCLIARHFCVRRQGNEIARGPSPESPWG